jgi:RHS repeat-associated protein
LRDPQGNVIAIYALARVDGNDVVTLTEQHIYGSARLGLQTRDLVVYNAPTGSGIAGGNRTSVLDSTGKKGSDSYRIVVTEIFPESVFGNTDNGRMVNLGNVSTDRISLDGLYLSSVGDAPWRSMQSFAVPEGYVLDSAERLVIAYGDGSAQDAMVSWLGWPADSSLQWVWQDGYVLSDSGEVSLVIWDDQDATALDVVAYGENGLRRTFAGREPEAAGDDFVFGSRSLGAPTLERKSIRFGFGEAYSWTQVRGGKSYELSDHLGNVAVVVGDRRMAFDPDTDLAVDFFEGEVLSARDFYPFGMVMPERSFSTQAYRYGFNGKEFDSEWKGEGNSYDYGFRVHDARLGRFLSVDPLAPEYPWYTPYQYAGNKPIWHIDFMGLAEGGETEKLKHTVSSGETLGKIANQYNSSIEELMDLNHLNDPNMIGVGQELLVPGASGSIAQKRPIMHVMLISDDPVWDDMASRTEEQVKPGTNVVFLRVGNIKDAKRQIEREIIDKGFEVGKMVIASHGWVDNAHFFVGAQRIEEGNSSLMRAFRPYFGSESVLIITACNGGNQDIPGSGLIPSVTNAVQIPVFASQSWVTTRGFLGWPLTGNENKSHSFWEKKYPGIISYESSRANKGKWLLSLPNNSPFAPYFGGRRLILGLPTLIIEDDITINFDFK